MGKIIDRVRGREVAAEQRRAHQQVLRDLRTHPGGIHYIEAPPVEPIDWARVALGVVYGGSVCGLLVCGGWVIGRML